MKTLKTVFLITAILTLVACSSDDDAQPVTTNEFEDIVMNLSQGTWEVTNFNNNGTDETANFEGFEFAFREDGVLSASTDLFTETGSWLYDDASSDSGDDKEELDITFQDPVTESFDDISEDWDILSASETEVNLTEENDAGTKVLVFRKL